MRSRIAPSLKHLLLHVLLFVVAVTSSIGAQTDTEACAAALPSSGYWDGGVDEHLITGRRINGTLQAQRIIHAHQHPPQCSTASFSIMGPWWGGIGGRINFIAAALGAAMQNNQVFLLDFGNEVFTKGSFCSGIQTFDTCFFLPLSSCTLDDVYGPGTIARAAQGHLSLEQIAAMRADIQATKNPRFAFDVQPHQPRRGWHVFPHQTIKVHRDVQRHSSAKLASQLFLHGRRGEYWWRTQATMYIVRPNARLLAALRARREQVFAGLTIPRGTTSVHVRHGDKFKEVRPVTNAEHGMGALYLLDAHPELQRRVFISSEDPTAVTYFQGLVKQSDLTQVLFLNVTRDNLRGLSPTMVADPTSEFIDSMLNLDIALQCDAFICSLESRWCDLINRLRLTTRCKAQTPFLCIQRFMRRNDNGICSTESRWCDLVDRLLQTEQCKMQTPLQCIQQFLNYNGTKGIDRTADMPLG